MTLNIVSLNTQPIFEHEKLFQTLTPDVVNNTLTAALVYNKEQNSFSITMKDSLAALRLKMLCTIDGVTSDTKSFGVFFEFSKLMYIFRSYSETDLMGLIIKVSYDEKKETSSLVITCKSDKLSLPHMVMTEAQLQDYLDLEISAPEDTSEFFSFSSLDDDQKRDFTSALSNSLYFYDNDEKKNNAAALYKDKLIANDSKHVFVYNFDKPIAVADEWIPIHKRSVKIISSLIQSALLNSLFISSKMIYLTTDNVECKMNNAVSNIAPPNEQNLANISSERHAVSIDLEQFKETSNFFSGFYTTNSGMSPLRLSFKPDEITFILQDSGIADFGSCNIERVVPVTNSDIAEYTIINDSLKTFLNRVPPSETQVMLYGQADKPAVKLKTSKMSIYLARLQ